VNTRGHPASVSALANHSTNCDILSCTTPYACLLPCTRISLLI
jgi:hypothetical protein